jgi:hypothetical protein
MSLREMIKNVYKNFESKIWQNIENQYGWFKFKILNGKYGILNRGMAGGILLPFTKLVYYNLVYNNINKEVN